MDLDLEIVRRRGREELTWKVVRPLERADFALLNADKGTKPPSLVKRLSERHHGLARALAGGMTCAQAAAMTGYASSRVSILQGDPAFQELVEFYRREVDAKFVEVHELLAGVTTDALLELRERLEETPEKFKVNELLNIAQMGADRTGNGPTSKQEVNVNVNLANRLEEARKRVAQRMIDITPERKAS